MGEKESVEEKIARIVRDTMAGERQRAEDEKDPGISKLRRVVREELSSLLGELRSDKGGSKQRQRADDDEDTSIASLLGLK